MKYFYATIVFISGELVGTIIFFIINRHLGPDRNAPLEPIPILKGILERMVLYIALLHGFPQMLIAFGTMKLGTRLHHEQASEISNSYFLVGNMVSMLLAMLYAIITKSIWGV